MNRIIQLHQISPEVLADLISQKLREHLNSVQLDYKETENSKYLTRKEVADLLSISLPTLHDWCKKSILTPYRMGCRIYFKTDEIDKALKKIHGP